MKKKITAAVTALSILAFGALTLNASSTAGAAQSAHSVINVQVDAAIPSASVETPQAWLVTAAKVAYNFATNVVKANGAAARNASIYGSFAGTEANAVNVGDEERIFDK